MAIKRIILILLLLIIFSTGFILAAQPPSEITVLTGSDIQGIINGSLSRDNLVIEIYRSYPVEIREDLGCALTDYAESGESIYIFGDGVVFSDRSFNINAKKKLEAEGYEFDDTWKDTSGRGTSFSRRVKFALSEDQLNEFLARLAEIEGDLLPGELIWGHIFYAEIRITCVAGEGRLREPIMAGVGLPERLTLINSIIDKFRDIEWPMEVETDVYAFIDNLKAKKEEYGWSREPKLEGIEYNSLQDAWEAHGLEIPRE